MTGFGKSEVSLPTKKITVEVRSLNSKQLDLASFDRPEFYEKMENANREAGHRPLHILSETLGVVSSVIELISFLIVLLSVPGLSWITFVVMAVSVPSAASSWAFSSSSF